MDSPGAVRPLTYRELTRRYWKWEATGVGIIVVGIGLCWLLLVVAARLRFAPQEGETYCLWPAEFLWGIPAFFAGILLAVWPTDLLYRRLLGERYPEFRDYQTQKFGYDGPVWMPLFYLVFGTGTAVFVALMLDCYIRFGPDVIEVDGLWSLEARRYAYEQVMQIRASDRREGADGQAVERYTVAMHFSDGTVWASNHERWYEGRQRLREIAAHVSAHAGIPIVELRVLSRAELLPSGLLEDPL